MKIISTWSGHDCSYCVLENGRPVIHDELERFTREKEPSGDGISFMFENYKEYDDIKHFVTCHPYAKTSHYKESLEKLTKII